MLTNGENLEVEPATEVSALNPENVIKSIKYTNSIIKAGVGS